MNFRARTFSFRRRRFLLRALPSSVVVLPLVYFLDDLDRSLRNPLSREAIERPLDRSLGSKCHPVRVSQDATHLVARGFNANALDPPVLGERREPIRVSLRSPRLINLPV